MVGSYIIKTAVHTRHRLSEKHYSKLYKNAYDCLQAEWNNMRVKPHKCIFAKTEDTNIISVHIFKSQQQPYQKAYHKYSNIANYV